jgi:dTDP-4-amino-4,6-dideoxygalactose transaminase
MSEFNAALGLLQLEGVAPSIARRRALHDRYREALAGVPGLALLDSGNPDGHNHAYCTILVDRPYPLSRDDLVLSLKMQNIFARRYFFPLLSSLPMYQELPSAHPDLLPVAHWAARRVLCLPIYPDLDDASQLRIITALCSPRAVT